MKTTVVVHKIRINEERIDIDTFCKLKQTLEYLIFMLLENVDLCSLSDRYEANVVAKIAVE